MLTWDGWLEALVPEFFRKELELDPGTEDRGGLDRAGRALAERGRRELHWPLQGRMPQQRVLPVVS